MTYVLFASIYLTHQLDLKGGFIFAPINETECLLNLKRDS